MTTMRYTIESRAGVHHGIWKGDTPAEAFRAMLAEAGDTYGSETAGTETDWIIREVEPATTIDTVTSDQIRALRDEAGAHGDLEMVAICERALAEAPEAWAECVRVIASAADARN